MRKELESRIGASSMRCLRRTVVRRRVRQYDARSDVRWFLVAKDPKDQAGVVGEVWSIDDDALKRLDHFEGVHEGLYRREPLPLQPPYADRAIDAYVSVLPITGRREVGSEWVE